MIDAPRILQICGSILVTVLLLATADAWGQDPKGAPKPPAAAKKEARALFGRGETEYRLGNFKAALGHYQAALKLRRHPSILFNIAQCHRQLGDARKAVFSYEVYLVDWRKTYPNKPVRYEQEVKRHIKALKVAILREEERRRQREAEEAEKQRQERLAAEREQKQKQKEEAARAEARRLAARRAQQAPRQQKQAPPPPEPRRDKRWLIGVVGGAALAAGAEALAVAFYYQADEHYKETAPWQDDKNVMIAGHVLAGVFAAGAVASLVMYLRSEEAQLLSGDEAALVPLPGGAAATLRIKF